MIILLSQSSWEHTTDLVFEWVIHLGGDVKRLNGVDLLNVNFNIDLNEDFSINFKNENLDFQKVNVLWYRRWLNSETILDISKERNSYLRREFYALTQYFFSFFEKKKWYNNHNYFDEYICKAQQLLIAKEIGFKIPPTLITDNIEDLKNFAKKNGSLIFKPLSEVETFRDLENNQIVGVFTERVDIEYIDNKFRNEFFPTLFQKEIKKKYELRIFFNKGESYAMAIFSAENKKTEIDFRQYDMIKPNRNVPYMLNVEEKFKIKKFMETVKLETGSLDLILSTEDEMFFLEVNPLGQFGMVSSPCNYYIEKKIAENLIKLDSDAK